MKKEALVSLPITSIGFNRPPTPEKLALINMQAEGLACLQSIVYESPPDIKRCRLQQWPEEVSRFQQFCMELHKPIETGFALLAPIMKYSPRAWHQSSKHRCGLKSIAEEHKNSFFKYTSSISSEAELWAWQLAFNYHAMKRNLGLALECTSDGFLYQRKRPTAPKRKLAMASCEEEQAVLSSLYQSISTRQLISDAQRERLKETYECCKSLCTQTQASNQIIQEHKQVKRSGRYAGATCRGRYPTVRRAQNGYCLA